MNDGDCARMWSLIDTGALVDEIVDATDANGNVFQTTSLIQAVSEE